MPLIFTSNPTPPPEEHSMTAFIRATAIRAARTVAQALIAAIGASVVLADVDWPVVVSTAALAGLLSVLNSVATGLPEVDDES